MPGALCSRPSRSRPAATCGRPGALGRLLVPPQPGNVTSRAGSPAGTALPRCPACRTPPPHQVPRSRTARTCPSSSHKRGAPRRPPPRRRAPGTRTAAPRPARPRGPAAAPAPARPLPERRRPLHPDPAPWGRGAATMLPAAPRLPATPALLRMRCGRPAPPAAFPRPARSAEHPRGRLPRVPAPPPPARPRLEPPGGPSLPRRYLPASPAPLPGREAAPAASFLASPGQGPGRGSGSGTGTGEQRGPGASGGGALSPPESGGGCAGRGCLQQRRLNTGKRWLQVILGALLCHLRARNESNESSAVCVRVSAALTPLGSARLGITELGCHRGIPAGAPLGAVSVSRDRASLPARAAACSGSKWGWEPGGQFSQDC